MLKTIITITLAIFAAALRTLAGILPEEKSAAPWKVGMRKILPTLKTASLAALIAVASSFVAPQEAAAQAVGAECNITLRGELSLSGLSTTMDHGCRGTFSFTGNCSDEPVVVIPASFLSSVFSAASSGNVGRVVDSIVASLRETESGREFIAMTIPDDLVEVAAQIREVQVDTSQRELRGEVELKCTGRACISYAAQ